MKEKQNVLKAKIKKLEDDIDKHNSLNKRLEELESKITTKVDQTCETNVPPNPTATSKVQLLTPSTLDRKFNISIYGLEESPVTTNKQGHTRHDLDCLMRLFSELKLNVTHDSSRDFHRLGKFNQQNTRPHHIIVKFLRAVEATQVGVPCHLGSQLSQTCLLRNVKLKVFF